MKFSSTITAAALFVITLFTVSAGHAEPVRLGMTPEPWMPFTQVNQAGVCEEFFSDVDDLKFKDSNIQTHW